MTVPFSFWSFFMTENNLAHSKISPTAKMVAYWRQTADLPYSHEVSELSEAKKVVQEMFQQKGEDSPLNQIFVSYIELRYRSLEQAIRTSGIKQVLEFASGISLRGLAMTEDHSLTYVESDLPDLTREKMKLVCEIKRIKNIPDRSNLHFATTNILHEDEVKDVLKHFDPKQPIIVLHEGLFQYLSKEEKKKASMHIANILDQFGGLWITPDFDTVADANKHMEYTDEIKDMFKALSRTTGRSVEDNRFQDDTEVRHFLEGLGFSVEKLYNGILD